jgi:hypothetical protein
MKLPQGAFGGMPVLIGGDGVGCGEVRGLIQRLTRQRVLHIALNPVERGILHLFCRLNIQVKSRMLRSTLASILKKASLWLAPSFISRALSTGRPLAAANVRAALAMGNRSATAWAEDGDYVLLLGVNIMGAGPPCQRSRS